MAVMHARRKQPASWPPAPAESGAIDDVRALRDRIDVGGRKAEILEGRLVVSPMPVLWHERACYWLFRGLLGVCDEKGWFPDRGPEIELPPTRDLIEPDLLILRDVAELPRLESLRPLDHVVLVAEVVSASSIREDRQVKPRNCALAGVPLFLLVDRFADPLSVSVYSEPGKDGYAKQATAAHGEKLLIPAPLDLALDTSALPLPG